MNDEIQMGVFVMRYVVHDMKSPNLCMNVKTITTSRAA